MFSGRGRRTVAGANRQVIKAMIEGIIFAHDTHRLIGRISGCGKEEQAKR